MATTVRLLGVRALWAKGLTGRGVDVALVDSGVVPVNGLTAEGKIVNGPDLSPEADDEERAYLDTFGHGTHMAGIVAGRDNAVVSDAQRRDPQNFVGVAPDARIVSVKVADAEGRTSLARVVRAIDWVVQHRSEDGLNIRVLNLSFGADALSDYRLDPLVHAVDRAWRAGIVVVVAAGNGGEESGRLDSPAYDPQVIAVGADDPHGTASIGDDEVPNWSSSGDGRRNPDVVAPGRSIVSLRDRGSYIDQQHPAGRVGSRFFRGSGTSAATAVVSGAAALLLQQRPQLTPDEVKSLLMSTAGAVPGADATRQGAGLVNIRAAASASAAGSGTSGDLDLSSSPPDDVPSAVSRPPGAFLDGWTGNSWSGNSWSGNSWSGNSWSGNSWSLVEPDEPQ
jgi:serine protease AprX